MKNLIKIVTVLLLSQLSTIVWATNGHLILYRTNGTVATKCDGTVVGKKLVLTAADCLHTGGNEGTPRYIEFFPNFTGLKSHTKPSFIAFYTLPIKYYEQEIKKDNLNMKRVFQNNLALIALSDPNTGKWIGEVFPHTKITDIYDLRHARNGDIANIVIKGYNPNKNHEPEEESCRINLRSDSILAGVFETNCKLKASEGAGVFEATSEGKFLIGVLSGINKTTNTAVITTFGRFYKDLEGFIEEVSSSDHLKLNRMKNESLHSITIGNECKKSGKISASIVMKSYFSGEQEIQTIHQIAYGERALFFLKTNQDHFFFRATSNSGMNWGKGDFFFSSQESNGKTLEYKRATIDRSKKHSVENINLTCN